jgi:hypothetical protein
MPVRQPSDRRKTNAKHYDLKTSSNREIVVDCLKTVLRRPKSVKIRRNNVRVEMLVCDVVAT